MLSSFTALDFETAQGYRHSICQVGMVQMEYNTEKQSYEVVNTINILVRPPENYYWTKFIDIHGITPGMTANSPTFREVWPQLKPFIEAKNIVAHNISFDSGCLRGTLEHYKLKVPEYTRYCTLQIYGKGLAKCCAEHNIKLTHHDALSDALACAELFKKHLENEKTYKDLEMLPAIFASGN